MQTVVDDPRASAQKRKARHTNTQIQENERPKKDDELISNARLRSAVNRVKYRKGKAASPTYIIIDEPSS